MNNAKEKLVSLIRQAVAQRDQKWATGVFSEIKFLSSTEKGNIIEDFAMWLEEAAGYTTKKPESRRGHWDIEIGGKKFEVKMASQDIKANFQFNGIRYDTKYDFLMTIGITPNEILFGIHKKAELHGLSLVSMQKGANAAYKLTRNVNDLHPISTFREVITEHLNK